MGDIQKVEQQGALVNSPQECFACRVIGTGALAVTGVYALNMSRAHQPGSVTGKRIMGALGVGFLVGSVFRWAKS